jgi:hypothetical protein
MHCSSHFPAGLTEALWTVLPDPTRRMQDPYKHPDTAASAAWHFTFSGPLWQVRQTPPPHPGSSALLVNQGWITPPAQYPEQGDKR